MMFLFGTPFSPEGTKALVTAAKDFLVVNQVLCVDMSKDTCFEWVDNIGREERLILKISNQSSA
jgi:hypothetical protein